MRLTAISCAVCVYLFSSTEAALTLLFYDGKEVSAPSTASSANHLWPDGPSADSSEDGSSYLDDWSPLARLIIFGVILVIALLSCIGSVYFCGRTVAVAAPRTSNRPMVTARNRALGEPIDFSKPFALKCSADGSFYASPVQDILPLPNYEHAVQFAKKSHRDFMQV